MWLPFRKNNNEQTDNESSNPLKKIAATVTAAAFDGFFNNIFYKSNNGLELVPVYASIKIISQSIAIANLKLYKKTDKSREEDKTSSFDKLLKNPTDYMTFYNFMQATCVNMVGRGNAYAMIVRDVNYEISELIPLKYDTVAIVEDINSSIFYYQVNYNGKTLNLWPEDILHFKAFTEDGLIGINPIELHRKTIQSATNEATYNETFYQKAVNISGVIEAPNRMDKPSIEAVKTGFGENYGGNINSGKTAVLADGMTYKQLKMLSPTDVNYIQGAKLTRGDIAVIFGVPLTMLGDLSQATFSNMSELNRSFYKTTLAPYFIAIAQEMNSKLLTEADKETKYFEFDPDILLATSRKERYETYNIGIDGGYFLRSEARKEENLSYVEGLDEPMQKSGVMTTSQADANFKQQDKQRNQKTEVEDKENKKDINDIRSQLGRLNQLVSHLQDNSNKKGDDNE